MNTHTAVEVFLGKHIDVPSEQQFLARLQRDLQTLEVSARILANLQVGRLGDRQIDFVIVTEWRTTVIELKTYAGPIISGPRNGPWTIQVGAGTIKERDNPLEQVRTASQYFSDELQAFADHANAPGPRKTIGPKGPKFYTDLDAVACVFPTVPSGSTWEEIRHTKLVGYDGLLDRLQRPGPTLQWSPEHWDKLVRHLNLYRADEDAPKSIVRRTGAAVIDAYAGLYQDAHAGAAPIAATAVMVDGTPAARPDVTKMVSGGATVLLRGSSGAGKSLWARAVAVELARYGHLPIWIDADMCDGPFLTACAQAIAPYTALNVNELLKAADAAGRAVVFVVDDFSKIPGQSRRRLLDGLRTARVRATGRGLFITDQGANHANQLGAHTDIELLAPDDDDRRGVLAAYGQAELIDRCEAFATPLELSVAAQCADDLGSELSHAELFDTYIDKLVAGDPQTRSGLRSIAAHMTADLRPFQRRGDAARRLRRDLGMSDERVHSVFECDLLVDAPGRISFRHEQFERFLAAESMLLSETDSVMLSRQLNSPSLAGLRRDVIALETDRDRLETLLSLCGDADVLVDAANGQLGVAAAGVVAGVLIEAVNDACAQTTGPGIKLRTTADIWRGCEWELPSPVRGPQITQLSATGLLISQGTWIDGVDMLLRHSDELCAHALQQVDPNVADAFAGHLFASTYVFQPSGGLPVSPLVEAATNRFRFWHEDPERLDEVIDRLLPDAAEWSPGALYVAAHLLRAHDVPLRIDVILRCVESGPFHLQSAGLHLAEDRADSLTEAQRKEVVDQIDALSTNNLAVNTAQIEALARLGGLSPAKNDEDIVAEIQQTLSMKGDPEANKLAYGIISNQFEEEVVGPYFEVVSAMAEDERLQLLAMALNGCEHGWTTDTYILAEIKNLSLTDVQEAVSQYVARSVPKDSISPQEATHAVLLAVALLTRAGLPVPDSTVGDRDPAWQRALELMSAAAGNDRDRLADAWQTFAGDHPYSVASFIAKLSGGWGIGREVALVARLEAALPLVAVDALVAALEHPDRVETIAGRDHGLRRDIVTRLSEVGERRAAEVLRRLANDPEIGESATEAIRLIESRLADS